MIGRAIMLLLAVVLFFALIGKWATPRVPRGRSRPAVESARKCPDCGAYVLGSRPTPCERADCRFRQA